MGEERFGEQSDDDGRDHLTPKTTEFPDYESYLSRVGVVLSNPEEEASPSLGKM
jgi:hypothetical protein